jgi:hypothetical protein
VKGIELRREVLDRPEPTVVTDLRGARDVSRYRAAQRRGQRRNRNAQPERASFELEDPERHVEIN